MDFIAEIKEKAKKHKRRIVFPEGEDERTLNACKVLVQQNMVEPILLGNEAVIKKRLKELGYDAKVRDPLKDSRSDEYAKMLFSIRKSKGLTIEKANELIKDTSYFGMMILYLGEADGLVSGALHTTADTLRPALQIIKTRPDVKMASSFFIIIVKEKLYFFADCGFNIKPSSEELADIAYSTIQSARFFGTEPKVAFLSFSTKGSAEHEEVTKVQKAVEIFRSKNPGCVFDGEMQLDAAIVPSVAERKAPDSPIKGDANVLIFPDLAAGNIGYKLVERFGNATAIGPIVQGLNKPVNDLSRGCDMEDIVFVAAITALQVQD